MSQWVKNLPAMQEMQETWVPSVGWEKSFAVLTATQWLHLGKPPHLLGFPRASDGNESACNKGDLGSITGLGRSPGEGQGNPLQYSCLGNPHGQRSLVGYSP